MNQIKNTTIYTKETIRTFLEIYFFERIKKLRVFLNIFIIVIIVSFFTSSTKTALDIISFIFALIGILEVNTSIIPKINFFKLVKTKNKIIDSKITYLFKEHNFQIDTNEYIDYNNLKKIIETNKYYYLYTSNSKAFIVDKSNLKNDEIEKLTSILKEEVSTYIYKKNV